MTDDEYKRIWSALVMRGMELRKTKHARSRRKAKSRPSNSIAFAPEYIRRWIVERSNGATVKDATATTGATWEDVNSLFRFCQECRDAVSAMLESRRLLEIENAYCDLEESIIGNVSERKAKFAMDVIARQED